MFEVKDIKETALADNPVVERMSKYNHEQLLFCNDNATGLKAIIIKRYLINNKKAIKR